MSAAFIVLIIASVYAFILTAWCTGLERRIERLEGKCRPDCTMVPPHPGLTCTSPPPPQREP